MAEFERNKQTVVAFFTRAFNDHEPADAVARYVGSQYIQHNPDTPDGAEAFVKNTQFMIQRFPGLRVEIKRAIAEGDLVAVHWTIWGTNTQPGMGFPATGKKIRISGITIFRFKAGKIAEEWGAFDMLSVLKQLGLFPPKS